MPLDKEMMEKLDRITSQLDELYPIDEIYPKTGLSNNDLVNSPSHYTSGSIECIDALREALSKEEFEGLCKGSALQYIWRESKKNGSEDIKKAIWYLNKLLSTR